MARRVGLAALLTLILAAGCAPAAQPTAPAATPPAPAAATAAKPASSPDAKGAPAPAAKPQIGDLRFAYPTNTITMLPMYIASKRGFDKEEGFNAILTASPGAVGVKAMVAGEFDFSMSVGSSLAAAVQGAPVRVVAVHIAKSLFWLYSKPDIKRVQDMQGKSIAVDTIGGSQDSAARLVLQRNGVDPNTVKFIAITGGGPPGALIAGAVDSAVIAPPQDVKILESGNFTSLGFLGDELPSLSSGLATTEKMLRDRPEAVKAAVRAAMKGQRFLQQNRQDAIPLMMEFLNLTEAQANDAYKNTIQHFTADGTITPELQARMVADQVAALKPEREPRPQDLFALQYAQEAK